MQIHKEPTDYQVEVELFSDRKKRIYQFLRQNPIGVLSLVDHDTGPHGVVIYYDVSENFELSFITRVETRKHHDLQHDNRVMLTVYEPESQTTVQVDGHAFEVDDNYEVNRIAGAILGASLKTKARGIMPLSKLKAGPYTAYRINPDHVRMAVYSRPDAGSYEQIFESIESYELV